MLISINVKVTTLKSKKVAYWFITVSWLMWLISMAWNETKLKCPLTKLSKSCIAVTLWNVNWA